MHFPLQLKYFASIKGQSLHLGEDAFDQSKESNKSTAERTEDLLQELHLLDQAETQAMELTASAKRRLSLAIAMIGDPQVHPPSLYYISIGYIFSLFALSVVF